MPAAIVLLVGGVVACFFGYRLFRIVLALFGFILGALAASSIFGMSDTGPMIGAAVAGGLVGAAILIGAYFVGVALVGAALGAVPRRRMSCEIQAFLRLLKFQRDGASAAPTTLAHFGEC